MKLNWKKITLMRNLNKVIACILCFCLVVLSGYRSSYSMTLEEKLHSLSKQIAQAQKEENIEEIYSLVQEMQTVLGDKAGVPEQREKYISIPDSFHVFAEEYVPQAFLDHEEFIRSAWWNSCPSSGECKGALREVSSAIIGCLHARNAGCKNPDNLLLLAKQAGDFLIYAQDSAGAGVYPCPDLRGTGGRMDELVTAFLKKAEQKGVLDQVLHNGWIMEDFESGDLFFDHGLCGFALLELYEETKDPLYLTSALWAAQWLNDRPSVPNWNYNSFVVLFLVRLARVTGDATFFSSAIKRVQLGIIPGQLQNGPNSGKWIDPHNARFVYHMIIVRSLIEVLEAGNEFQDDVAAEEMKSIRHSFSLAMECRYKELIDFGFNHPDITCECFSRIRLAPDTFKDYLSDSLFQEIEENLDRYVGETYRRGTIKLSPAALGYYLEALVE